MVPKRVSKIHERDSAYVSILVINCKEECRAKNCRPADFCSVLALVNVLRQLV